MESGRERVLKTIKSKTIGGLIGGIVLLLVGVFLALCGYGMITTDESDRGGGIFLAIAGGIVLLIGLYIMIRMILTLGDPSKSSTLKKNPELLEMADELFQNIIHQDENLLLSPRVIANAKDLREMVYTDEVFLAYVYTHRTNGVVDTKQITVQTAREPLGINILRKKDAEVDAIFALIAQNCRYVKMGYTDEGLSYLKQMQEAWKRDRIAKGKA